MNTLFNNAYPSIQVFEKREEKVVTHLRHKVMLRLTI